MGELDLVELTSVELETAEPFGGQEVWADLRDGWLRVEASAADKNNHYVMLRRVDDYSRKSLTEREVQVVERIAAGGCPTVIGFDLHINASTVATHLASGLHKLTGGSRHGLYQAWCLVHALDSRRKYLANSGTWLVARPRQSFPGQSSLSPAETHVVEYVMRGASNADIAAKRRVSKRTIANQLATVFQKLQIADRHELALLVLTGERRIECQCA